MDLFIYCIYLFMFYCFFVFFNSNASFDGIGLSRKSSFGESMDSGVDLDIKVESKV